MKLSSPYFLLIAVLASVIAQAQVATGTPPFASFGGGPFDTVNLGNLNVHLSIPVLHKSGRGMPFTYDLSYDSSVWTPLTSSGTKQWQPALNWGWRGVTEVATGYVSYKSGPITLCVGDPPTPPTLGISFSNWVYHDPFGTSHAFPRTAHTGANTSTCHVSALGMNAVATDGSGYTLQTTTTSPNIPIMTSTGGKVGVPPYNITGGSATYTDANGNQINVNTTGQFFDTLSSATPVLTVSSPAPPTATTFTYTAPSGAGAIYTMNYLQYTVKTSFGVTGVSEYGPLTNSLVSSITLPDGSSYTFTYEQTPGSCTPNTGTQPTCVTGRVKEVTLPTGGTITYAYTGGSNGIESDGSTSGLNRTLNPGGEWQYARSGSGSAWTTTVTDPNLNQTIIDFAKDGSTVNPSTNFYETQRQVKQLISGTQTLLATVTRCYNAVYANCSTAAVSSPITQTDLYSQFPTLTRLSEVLYNSYGLVTDDKEYDYGVNTGAAPTTTKLIRETSIAYASLSNGIVNKPASVIVYDYTSGTKTEIASTTYTYDGTTPITSSGTPQHVAVTGSRGNLTTLATQVNTAETLYRRFTYYDTGAPDTSSAVSTSSISSCTSNPSSCTTYNYSSTTASCGNSFATSVSEPLSLSRSTTWNCAGGLPTQVTDENGNTVTSNYTDPDFWRPANVYDQENYETTISYIGETAVETTLQNFNGGSSSFDSRTTVDGFGRTIFSQRKQGPSATNYDTGEIDYNNVGLASRSTMAYGAAASPTSSNTTAPGTSTTYDALSRVVTIKDSDGGTVSYTYTDKDVLLAATGAQSFQKQLEYDGLGRLTSVCEISSTLTGVGTCGQATAKTGYWTRYTYDALGHLLTVTQNAQATSNQQTRTFAYDWLGRMISESNPETANNGTNGTTTYVYDSTTGGSCGTSSPGNLILTTRPDGSWICYIYDVLHRLTDVGNSSQSTTNACKRFRYDNTQGYFGARPSGVTVNNPNGRLVEVATDSCSTSDSKVTDEWFSYSPRGELTDVYENTPDSGGVYYHTTAAYWPTGTLETLSGIPGVPTINYGAAGAGLDGEGRITQVTAASGTNPVTSVTYSTSSTTNPLGALTGVTFGSADSDSFSYDPNTGRMTGYTFSVNSQTDVGALIWNTNGTLNQLKITDQITGTSDSQTCNYLYDDLQRLSSSNCGTPWSQTFTYDVFGNITKNGSSSFVPSYSLTQNQFTSIPGRTVSYDGNGNLLTDNLNTYTWDAYGRMSTVNTGSATVAAIYDGLGRIVENNAGGTYTEFVYGPTGAKLAQVNGNALIKAFVALPGGAKAIYNSTGLTYFRHSDWLGSSRLTSTATRPTLMYSSTAYAPFGESQQGQTAGTPDASLTGQDQNAVSSLYDFAFREQSSSQGRWISPDPAGLAAADPTNPQTWNRYAYVNNTPVNLIDPLGLCVLGGDTPCLVGGNPLHPHPQTPNGGGDGGGGTTCIWDGVESDCSMVEGAVGSGAAVPCPDNFCGGFINGQYVQFIETAGGTQGYLNPGLFTKGLGENNGQLAIWVPGGCIDTGGGESCAAGSYMSLSDFQSSAAGTLNDMMRIQASTQADGTIVPMSNQDWVIYQLANGLSGPMMTPCEFIGTYTAAAASVFLPIGPLGGAAYESWAPYVAYSSFGVGLATAVGCS